MKYFGAALISLCLSIGISPSSWAQGACMISRLEGQATVFHDKDQPRSVNKFKKLWPGDQLEVPKDATVQLNYLALGRVEKWKGPVRILIEDKGGRDQNKVQQPTITDLGDLTTVLKSSKLLNEQNATGHIAIRGTHAPQLEELQFQNVPLDQQGKDELKRFQARYNSLLQKAAQGDSTPDLYYLASLEGLGQMETMAQHIRTLLSMDGRNADLEEMLKAL